MFAAGLSYRESGPADGPVALMLHGYPESSFMWSGVMPAVADAGWRALALDFAGYGDSEPDPPSTWERHIESLERFRRELRIDSCVLVVHDWGGLIGMRWACEHPGVLRALVISSTGFFPNGKWHGMAKALREPGTGEQLIAGIDRDSFAAVMRQWSSGMSDEAITEYWKGYAVAALGVPTLLLWGEDDAFAPVAAAHRLEQGAAGDGARGRRGCVPLR